MKHASNESISALIDDELGAFETRRLLTEAARDPELREQWYRLHAASSAVREGIPPVPLSFADRVAAAIDLEPVPESDVAPAASPAAVAVARRSRSWMRPIAGSGVAAAVALVTIGIWGVGGDSPVPGASSPAIESAGVTMDPNALAQDARFAFTEGRVQGGSGSFSLTGGPSAGLINPLLVRPTFAVSANPFEHDSPKPLNGLIQDDAVDAVGRDAAQ